jgi:type IV pilus assembly protein PilA
MKKGFTLVEVLIVLVVIGIILAVILPNTLRAIEQANVRDTAATLRSIDSAVSVCYAQTRDWNACDSIADLMAGVPPYLDADPGNSPFGILYNIGEINGAGNGWLAVKTDHFPNWPALDPHN